MRCFTRFILWTLLVFIGFATPAAACSVSFLEAGGKAFVARNMDWPEPEGVVVKNYRGVEKSALLPPTGAVPYEWTSRWGSVTFDMYTDIPGVGKLNAPGCGLNEAGFYAAALFVSHPEYPGPGGKPALRCAEVVRVLLDTCATVPEALARLAEFGVTELIVGGVEFRLHWFLADRDGNAAIVEFPPENHGVMAVHFPPLYKTMTNDYYDPSYAALSQYLTFGGDKPIPGDDAKRTSDVRFVRNTFFSRQIIESGNVTRDDGFDLMGKVAQTEGNEGSQSHTVWTIVYDLKRLNLAWTAVSNSARRSVDLRLLDFGYAPEMYSMDIQSSGEGDVTAAFGERSNRNAGCETGAYSPAIVLLLVPLLILFFRHQKRFN
ncbi:MAG: linear amide C-N hydrolase [Synergistaceae bacterium]|nr:linear amide C-N hydrolase [Synergistaceae bacterium]